MLKQFFILKVWFAFCFCLTSCKNEKQVIVDSIIKYGVYEGMYLGPTDSISPQWRNYEALTTKFSEKELIELCEHKNPIVRSYAFKALTQSCSSEAYDVLLKHLSDTARFERFYGCIGDDDRVTDNFLDEVGYDKKRSTKFTLSEEQYNYIDSVLLFRDEVMERSVLASIKYRSRRYILERLKPLPQFYERIRDIAKKGVYEALPTLAKYQNPADTSIFKNFLLDDEFSNRGRTMTIYVRKAIRYFPHRSFYPILKKQVLEEVGTNAIWDSYECYPLYVALAQYPTNETRDLFEQVIKESPEGEVHERSKFIYYAVKTKPSKVFDGVVKINFDESDY